MQILVNGMKLNKLNTQNSGHFHGPLNLAILADRHSQ